MDGKEIELKYSEYFNNIVNATIALLAKLETQSAYPFVTTREVMAALGWPYSNLLFHDLRLVLRSAGFIETQLVIGVVGWALIARHIDDYLMGRYDD
jgi:hypothetical protein